MSREERRFEALARKARQESIPAIDVAGRVVAEIEARPAVPAIEWWFWGAAGLSVAAAVAVLLLSHQHDVLVQDPLDEWLSLLTLVIK